MNLRDVNIKTLFLKPLALRSSLSTLSTELLVQDFFEIIQMFHLEQSNKVSSSQMNKTQETKSLLMGLKCAEKTAIMRPKTSLNPNCCHGH